MTASPEMEEAARKRGGQEEVERVQAFISNNPPGSIAPMVVWLCTDEAANVNGRTFLVSHSSIGLYSEPQIFADVKSDHGWTLDELSKLVPEQVSKGLTNAWAPKEEAKA